MVLQALWRLRIEKSIASDLIYRLGKWEDVLQVKK